MGNKNKSLKIYEGDIQITKENSKEWEKKLEYTEIITGYVDIRENAKANFPNLKQSGSVDIQENAKANFPKLEAVRLCIYPRE